uniref:Uncharacterized protein n=1 Tax=Solanum tuberosum TaxID=4113 RepID=M1CU80_SOLTU
MNAESFYYGILLPLWSSSASVAFFDRFEDEIFLAKFQILIPTFNFNQETHKFQILKSTFSSNQETRVATIIEKISLAKAVISFFNVELKVFSIEVKKLKDYH